MNETDNEIDLLALLQRIYRRRFLACLIAVTAIVLSVAAALLSTPYFSVKTKIIYQSSAKTSGNLSALASLAGISMGSGGGDDASAYLGDVVRSADLMGQLLDRKWFVSEVLPDTSTPILLETLWEVNSDSTEINWQAQKRNNLLKRFSEGSYIQFSQDKKSGVITLATEFEDPRVAYDVNVFLFRELNNTLVNKMSFKATANRKFIEERLTEVKQDLVRSENNLKNYRERNRLRLDPGDQLEDARLQRDVLINQEVMVQLQKQYEMAKIEEARDLPVLDIIDSPRMPVEKSRPKRAQIVLIGLILGLLLGTLAAIGYDLWLERRGTGHSRLS